jgi:P-aminobenzoate N-oxygenase AurF
MQPQLQLPDEERRASARESFHQLTLRLSERSVDKHFDAYADIAWDRPEHRIDAADSIWELDADHALGRTAWYRALPAATRSRLGLHMVAASMRTGLEFENVLTRGLLLFAMGLPAGAPEFRYAYHEAIEESQHSLMFAEFVARAGLPAPGIGRWRRTISTRIVAMAKNFPELFFIFVLGGEDPIDHVQRSVIATGKNVHPLLRRIMQIHITEEARHLCFAREYLRTHVPALSSPRRAALALATPIILGNMARMMLRPAAVIEGTYQIPRAVLTEAYATPEQRARVVDSLAKVRALCTELALMPAPARALWRGLGLEARS